LWKLQHLTSLYLNDNHLTRIPPEICRLTCLVQLDLSCNKLRNLPPEIGELVTLRELLLHNNYIRALPLEMGKLFKLQILGLKGNPLSTDIMTLFSEVNGTDKILSYLLDNLPSKSTHEYFLLHHFAIIFCPSQLLLSSPQFDAVESR
jgi:CCR4-NOT transcription complex subunit 6